MELYEILKGLDDRQALVVHFSHHSNMRKGGVFPTDLREAMANKSAWTLSCCVVWPGHPMSLPGSVGVIFRPGRAEQVLSVSSGDSGSMVMPDGKDGSLGSDLSAESFENTFKVVEGEYNEWRVRDADVVGIFVADPERIAAKKHVPVPFNGSFLEEITAVSVPLEEVFDAFPGLSVYTMGPTGPVQLDRPKEQPSPLATPGQSELTQYQQPGADRASP